MTQRNQIYRCRVCGNMIEVLHSGAGELVCCNQPMNLLKPKSQEEGLEKHVPVVEKIEGGYLVKVGSLEHPMEEAHYIEWIELLAGDSVFRNFLSPEQKPEARFLINAQEASAREYCSVRGLWQS